MREDLNLTQIFSLYFTILSIPKSDHSNGTGNHSPKDVRDR